MAITVQNVVDALSLLGGEASIEAIHMKVLEIAEPPISTRSRQIVRGRLQDYCAESDAYRGKVALFDNVHGLKERKGVWRLRTGAVALLAEYRSAQNAEPAKRNPIWSRDEIILALDLYSTNPANPPGKESKAVAELSDLLNKMHRLNGIAGNSTLRNPNGVYLKMMNLRSLDPEFTTQGKVGMTSGGKLEKVIWAEYRGRRSDLAADAKVIRDTVVGADERKIAKLPDVEPYEGEEGGIVIRLHRRYERDRKIVAEKLKVAAAGGPLACEVCGFDFTERYGDLGKGFIEVHHLRPVHTLQPGAKTKISDLALLCSNCHRMAHRRRTPLTIEQLRSALKCGILAL